MPLPPYTADALIQTGSNTFRQLCNLANLKDITLSSTTLRYAGSNEVSTVSNGSLANARITNCARSKNAIVLLDLKLDIKLHKGNTVDRFRDAIDNYMLDNPNIWDVLLFFRCVEIDPDWGYVTYRIGVRSTKTWQGSMGILADRAQLHRFCMDLAEQLQVEYDSPIPRRLLYHGDAKDLTCNGSAQTHPLPDPNIARSSTSSHDRGLMSLSGNNS